jgi:hypothetical protein
MPPLAHCYTAVLYLEIVDGFQLSGVVVSLSTPLCMCIATSMCRVLAMLSVQQSPVVVPSAVVQEGLSTNISMPSKDLK